MEAAFWDSSSLVPLCIQQNSMAIVQRQIEKYSLVVWWSTLVELKSAFARLLRMGHMTSTEFASAQVDLDQLRHAWQEINPSQPLRDQAESFVDRFQLKAADAQQLAAAFIWALGRPTGRVFLSGDVQLLAAARQLGFQAVET